MHGYDALALLNNARIAFSDSPTYLFRISGPLTAMKLALEALATALANNVLPQPGGPHNNTPAGARTANL